MNIKGQKNKFFGTNLGRLVEKKKDVYETTTLSNHILLSTSFYYANIILVYGASPFL